MALARALDGQVALVTGGGKGIGRAIALELSAQGAAVLVVGRDERALGETVGEIAHGGGKARHQRVDVRDAAQVHAAIERATADWGRLDIAIANAGITGTARLGEASGHPAQPPKAGPPPAVDALELARAIFDTNLLGTYVTFHAALAAMRGPGRLVAVSSVLGKLGVAGQAAYCASKAGVHGLVRAVAVEVGPRAITCNAVCPGWVDTDMADARMAGLAAEAGKSLADTERDAIGAVPLRRFVEVEEVARLVAFLCSAGGAAMTGQALSICGGTTPFAG